MAWIKARLSWLWHKGLSWFETKIAIASVCFLGLNTLDAMLTNRAYQIANSVGVAQAVEQNPILRPFAGSWMLSFKGLICLGVIAIVARIKKLPRGRVLLWIIIGCLLVTSIILWNMHQIGWY